MKKSLIFGAVLLALGFVSCSEDNTLGIPQVNPQGPILESNGVEVALGQALAGQDLNLNDYTDGKVPVIRLVEADSLYQGGVHFVMELATNEDFAGATELTVTDGSVSRTEWDEYFRKELGRSPKAKQMYVRFQALASVGDQLIRIGGLDNYYGAKTIMVTPIPMDFTIENAYYLIGTCNDWALSAAYPFKHSDADVYDDPVFTIVVNISEEQAAGGWWWKIAPQSAIDSNDWANVDGTEVDGDEALEGKIVLGNDKCKAGCMKKAGTFLMTINMEDLTWSFKELEFMYTPGASNGWSQEASQKLMFDANKNLYVGFAHLNGEFKISSKPNWDGTNYGKGDGDGVLSTDGGAGNLSVPEDGLYWVTVDIQGLKYTTTLITSLGAIGDMNGWGAQEPMTVSADFLTWTGDVTFAAGNGWKFRANDNWDINLGGDASNLTLDGANLPAPGEGTYTVTLNLNNVPYTYTAVKK